MTEWHLLWQAYLEFYKSAETEVHITHSGETHRADAVLPGGRIIELQHSSLSPEEINLREEFYGKELVWIFDVREAYETKRLHLRKKDGKDTFRWKQPKRSIAFARRKVYLDLGAGSCLELTKMYQTSPCGGFGKLRHSIDLEEFLGMNT
jgi:competence protein CoiA